MTPATPSPPRILLVEDDTASRAFMSIAVAALPAEVVEASGCAQALVQAGGDAPFDLWLVDARLGDGDGITLLSALRARHPGVPALAHTASHDPVVHDALREAGFAGVVTKPVTAIALREAVRAALGNVAIEWNDAAALAALNRNQAHVEGLRKLFLDELPGQRDTVLSALRRGDREEALPMLHRLRASCGFVGASRLADAVKLLEEDPGDAEALARFDAAVGALL